MKKKNTFMRLAMALVLLVLLTTSAVGGTFAKYTSSVSSQDSARVAKWGFKPVSMDITGLFSNVYDADATEYTVESAVDVIAPGTKGSAQFAFAYDETNGNAPEVDYTFVVSTDGSSIHKDIKDNTNIQWKLDDGTFGTWDSFIAAIEALDDDVAYYEAGTLPDEFTTADDIHTVYWQWVFEGNDSDDTDMGNAAALAEVKLVITITATQID